MLRRQPLGTSEPDRTGGNVTTHAIAALAPLDRLRQCANCAGDYVAMIGIRLLLAWEFGEAGIEKLRGENWFHHIQEDFPFPFSAVPTDVSWLLATWSEILGAAALVIGFATRFFSLSLVILTLVAWYSVHAGNGYNVCDNGFKLPLMYLVLFVPLILNGPGKLSLDHLLLRRYRSER
jgi:putative oxidoreductase